MTHNLVLMTFEMNVARMNGKQIETFIIFNTAI